MYSGRKIRFLLRNLHAGARFRHMKVNVAQFSSILEQLEMLTLHLERSLTSFLLPVRLSNLKQLEVVVPSNLTIHDASLLGLTHLIQSAPRLQKIVVESSRTSARFPKSELQRMKRENSAYPHPLLEEVEFVGFCGCPSDLEFVFHSVDNAAALKKILINMIE